MPVFDYRALTANGQSVEGRLDGASRRDVMAKLTAQGLTLLHLAERRGSTTVPAESRALPWRRARVSPRMRENFTRQLASLLGAGVPLATSLHRLSREGHHPAAKQTWQAIHDLVADGAGLADAMAQFPETFPRVYTAMVRAGEAGGFLDLVLAQIADFQSRDRELRSRVASALIYPSVLAVLAVGVVIFLLTYFIPRFRELFGDLGANLPALTEAIIGISTWVRRWGGLLALLAIVAVIVVRRWMQTESGCRRWEEFLLETPIIGKLLARFAMTRFCRMLGTLVGAGVPLVTALRVAAETLGNQVLSDAVTFAVQQVQRGNRLADSLAGCPRLFPGSVLEIISVAEQTARLDKELVHLAETSEKDLDRELHAAVSLAEPLMLFVMAAVVGTIVIGMVLPIFTLQEYIR